MFKQFDFTDKAKRFTYFVPDSVLNSIPNDAFPLGTWKPMLANKRNLLEDANFVDLVETIAKIDDNLIFVVFKEYHCDAQGVKTYVTGLYKGEIY